jgi:hypothetical protein
MPVGGKKQTSGADAHRLRWFADYPVPCGGFARRFNAGPEIPTGKAQPVGSKGKLARSSRHAGDARNDGGVPNAFSKRGASAPRGMCALAYRLETKMVCSCSLLHISLYAEQLERF